MADTSDNKTPIAWPTETEIWANIFWSEYWPRLTKEQRGMSRAAILQIISDLDCVESGFRDIVVETNTLCRVHNALANKLAE